MNKICRFLKENILIALLRKVFGSGGSLLKALVLLDTERYLISVLPVEFVTATCFEKKGFTKEGIKDPAK